MNQERNEQVIRILKLQEWLLTLVQSGELEQEELKRFQENLFNLIALIAEKSLGGIMQLQQEKAAQLMESVQYQIAYYLNQCIDREQQIDEIKNTSPAKLFQLGHESLIRDARESEVCVKELAQSMLSLGNQAYEETLTKGLPEFFEEYDVVLKAHEIPGEFDYPLCVPVKDLAGYDYVKEYLNHLCAEEELLRLFPVEKLQAVLQGYSREYAYLSVNVYELVLANVITNLVLEQSYEEMIQLSMNAEKIHRMQEILVENGWMKLCGLLADKLPILWRSSNAYLSENCKCYTLEAAKRILRNCVNNAHTDTLSQVIVIPTRFLKPQTTIYDTERRLSEIEFTDLLNELSAITNSKDKLARIRKNVHNMEDLMALLSECIFGEEARELFIQLSNHELAKFMLYVMDENETNAFCNYDGSANWHLELLLTIQSMDVVRQQEINQLIMKYKNK